VWSPFARAVGIEPDPCALLTAAEVTSVLGQPAKPKKEGRILMTA